MTRSTVLWSRAAEDDLAGIWCIYDDRQQITTAADQIDMALREDASQKGLLLPDGTRVISHRPLNAYFRVSIEGRKVFVGAVRLSEIN